MKLMTCVLLALTLTACGKGGSDSESKIKQTSLLEQSSMLAEEGVVVATGHIPGQEGDHVIVLCSNEHTRAPHTTNSDRARSLRAMSDRIRAGFEVSFSTGERVSVSVVQLAIEKAIRILSGDAASTTCPRELIGYQRY